MRLGLFTRVKGLCKFVAGVVVYLSAPVLAIFGGVYYFQGKAGQEDVQNRFAQSEEGVVAVQTRDEEIAKLDEQKKQGLIAPEAYDQMVSYYNSDEFMQYQLSQSSFASEYEVVTQRMETGVDAGILPACGTAVLSSFILMASSNKVKAYHYRSGNTTYKDYSFSILDTQVMEMAVNGVYEFVMGKKYGQDAKDESKEKIEERDLGRGK